MCQIVNCGRIISALGLVHIVKEFVKVEVWRSRKYVDNGRSSKLSHSNAVTDASIE